jgi:DNA-binding transcriptional ArsR family regulator
VRAGIKRDEYVDLFTPRANYRNEDPETSRAAAIDAEKSGHAPTWRARLLLAVRERPGLTAGEYADWLEVERAVVSRRLPELREAGLVVNGHARQCNSNGRKAMTWEPKGGNDGTAADS